MNQSKPRSNEGILNIITPNYLEFQKNQITLGENVGKFLSIVRYPSTPTYGWLSKLVALEGTTAKIQFEPTSSAELIERCNKQIREYRGELAVTKDESEKQIKEKAIKDISNMIRRINEEEEVVGYVNIILFVQAPNNAMLNARIKHIKGKIATVGGNVRVLTNLQKQAFNSLAPYGVIEEQLENFGSRNMPLSTFIGGFPNAKSGINDGIGMLIGKSDNDQLIILDTRKRGNDRTNMNWFITGITGMGKSTFIKLLNEYEFALGAKLIFNDPEREYIDLVKKLNGKVIDCGGGKGKINILQARYVPKLEEEEEEEEKEKEKEEEGEEKEEEIYQDMGRGTSALALHFQTIRAWIKAYKKQITEIQIALLEEILEKTYKRFGITWETDISKIKANDWPIISDLYEDILKEVKENPSNRDLEILKSLLRSAAIGADSFVFNGHTNVDFNTDVINLDTSALLEGDEAILRAQTYNINSFVWNYISKNRNEIVIYNVDEGYLSVDPDNPEAIIFMKNVSKRIRKYGGGLVFATHSCVDVLDPAVKRHGQAIIDNACYKFIMGTDGQNLKETSELFDLTEKEKNLLLAKQRGRGLLMAGSSRINAKIEVPKKLLELMGTAGGK